MRNQFGTVFFYLLWPLVWFYAPLTIRVRVILRVDDEALVVENWFGPKSWQLPGGGRKRGESVIEAARRELKEELALKLPVDKFVQLTGNAITSSHSGLIFRYHFVEVRLTSKPNITASHEVNSYEWRDISQITSLTPGGYQ